MRILLTLASALVLAAFSAHAQETPAPKPTVQDLEFLLGEWDIRTEFYDPYKPEEGIDFVETGTRSCRFDIEHKGVPMFVVC
ncbi:MAG TPA: hypothetical protein VD713_02885, partial [Sphingomonadales bacterium]|nr:hypothetical protein [Sphingomonadales bacterium]